MTSPVRLSTTAREIALAIDEVLGEDVWLDALNDNDFENDVVVNLVNDDFVIEVCTACDADELVELTAADERSRAVTMPAMPKAEVDLPVHDYDDWYAAYLRGGRPEPLPRSRAPRATSTMARPERPDSDRAPTLRPKG